MFLGFFLMFFSTGLVRLYIAGLPLRSCPDYWGTFLWRGSPNVCFFGSGSSSIQYAVPYFPRISHSFLKMSAKL